MRVVNTIPDTKVKFYGPNLEKDYKPFLIAKYNPNLAISDLKQIFNFDVIILWNKSRIEFCCPPDIYTTSIPKILVEGDYHKFRKNSWFKKLKLSMLIHRHKSNFIRGLEDFPHLKQVWLPCSVNTNIFHPTDTVKEKAIAFIGTTTQAYLYRNAAKKILLANNLLVDLHRVFEQNYINALHRYVGYLNCSSIYNIENAKAFEIMACGGLLFTNECPNAFQELFGKEAYITYKNDLTNLLSKTNFILQNPLLIESFTKNALKIIQTKHTHKIRAKELCDIISTEI
jgi:hypothetical protein